MLDTTNNPNVRPPSEITASILPRPRGRFHGITHYVTPSWSIGRHEACSRSGDHGFSFATSTDADAWNMVDELRLADLPEAERFWYGDEEHRRVNLGDHLSIRSSDALPRFVDPLHVVRADRAYAYLKRLPHGARFRLRFGGYRGLFTKLETDRFAGHILAQNDRGDRFVFDTGNLLVLFERPDER